MSIVLQEIAQLQVANKKNFIRLREELEKGQIDFVLTELDLGITFCEVALSTNNRKKSARNIENALKGYGAALRFCQGLDFDLEGDTQFRQKLASLKALLHKLSEVG